MTTARLFRVTGLVQGVGFRPTVHRIARELALAGEVFNDAEGVGVILEGPEEAVLRFPEVLRAQKPPLARIDDVVMTEVPATGRTEFTITKTKGGRVRTGITADAATCAACLEDLFDPANRRYRYAFTNCTHCGPRFTITKRLPYDRPQTTMAPFAMCPDCLTEYEDPLDRRFHAQPNACPVCGPKLELTLADRTPLPGDPVREAVRAIRDGKILAVKGLGGFHLACDARNPEAVARLRARKRRDEKAFALMAQSVASARRIALVTPEEKELLESVARPIVLLRKRPGVELAGIAPGLADVGVMLPYTPLHWLLFHTLAGEPSGTAWCSEASDALLVMTSANPSGEPLVIDNDEAYDRLGDLADLFLLHNRDILIRCDDSVVRRVAGKTLFVRRARGYVPDPIALPRAMPSAAATGPYLKNTAALIREKELYLTQHNGDLEGTGTRRALEDSIDHLAGLYEITPLLYASDTHPDFPSTTLAETRAKRDGVAHFLVQHHAAHVAAVMAESGASEGVGLALDGTGLGDDQTIWGGELLRVTPRGWTRLGHLKPLPLPGGDAAAREPRRVAAAVLTLLGREAEIPVRWPDLPGAALFGRLVHSELCPEASSTGRLFDAASALLGLVAVQHDEARAAMLLEAEAEKADEAPLWDDAVRVEDGVLDPLPIFERLLAEPDRTRAAAGFIRTLARGFAGLVRASGVTGRVAVTGGCVIDRPFTEALLADLAAVGVEGVLPLKAPPGDGGVAAGEAWLAALAQEAGVVPGPVNH